jgi:hypothetical protein
MAMINVHGIDVDVNGSGPFTLVSGSGHNGMKIFRILLTVKTGNPTITFYSGTNRLPGTFHLLEGGAVALGMELRRWAECAPGDDFTMHVSEDSQIGGALTVEYL